MVDSVTLYARNADFLLRRVTLYARNCFLQQRVTLWASNYFLQQRVTLCARNAPAVRRSGSRLSNTANCQTTIYRSGYT